jgi:hypothetical protein
MALLVTVKHLTTIKGLPYFQRRIPKRLLQHQLKGHLQLQLASSNQVDRRWLNGFMAAGFHSGLISLSELKLEYMKAHRNAYGERMTEAQAHKEQMN